MVTVSSSPLLEGHTFPDKETLLMRVAEEAHLFGVWIKIVRSDGLQVDVRGADGDPFHVVGYYGLNCWRSSLSVLVLILTLVSTGRLGRDAESV